MTLPLPEGATSVGGELEAHVLNCSNQTSGLRYSFTSQEIERAEFCGTEIGYRDAESTTVHSDFLRSSFYCADIARSFELQCQNTSGAIVLECPFRVPGASCQFWDNEVGNWSSAGCTPWKSNYEEGWVKCNCTHLTDFAAQQEDLFAEQTSTFIGTSNSVQELTIQDVKKNMGILIVLASIWTFCILTYSWDKRNQEIANIKYLLSISRSAHLIDLLHDLREVMVNTDAAPNKNDNAVGPTEPREPNKRLSFRADIDPNTASEINKELTQEISRNRRVFRNWLESMKSDNELLSWFFPGSWTSSLSARRGILMLAKIVTLLFLCCLAAPSQYLCPSDNDKAALDDDIGVASSFFGDYPDFFAIQKQDGFQSMLYAILRFLWDYAMELFYTTLWTIPAVNLMVLDLWLAQLLDTTDQLNEERLLEKSHHAIVRPETIMSLEEALVAKSMLCTLESPLPYTSITAMMWPN